jgi:hypothetical protein
MGHDADSILGIFRSPSYGGAHGAWRRLGDDAVRAIVAESVACFGAVRYVVRDCERRRLERESASARESQRTCEPRTSKRRFTIDPDSGEVVVVFEREEV